MARRLYFKYRDFDVVAFAPFYEISGISLSSYSLYLGSDHLTSYLVPFELHLKYQSYYSYNGPLSAIFKCDKNNVSSNISSRRADENRVEGCFVCAARDSDG